MTTFVPRPLGGNSPSVEAASSRCTGTAFCDRKFRDRSLQGIAEEERRWGFATTTTGMTPIQALELVRGFAAAVQESTPEAQREVVQRVFQRIAIADDRVTDVDVYPVDAEALRWYWRPRGGSWAHIPPALLKLRLNA